MRFKRPCEIPRRLASPHERRAGKLVPGRAMAAFSDLCSAQSTSISHGRASIPIKATLCNLESMAGLYAPSWPRQASRSAGWLGRPTVGFLTLSRASDLAILPGPAVTCRATVNTDLPTDLVIVMIIEPAPCDSPDLRMGYMLCRGQVHPLLDNRRLHRLRRSCDTLIGLGTREEKNRFQWPVCRHRTMIPH